MDILTIVLCSVVVIYFSVYTYKHISTLRKYVRAIDRGFVNEYIGVIINKSDEVKKSFRGQLIDYCYPTYSVSINEKERIYQSPVVRPNVNIGDEAIICYDEEDNILWVKEDVRLIKSQLKKNLLLILSMLAIMILVNIFL